MKSIPGHYQAHQEPDTLWQRISQALTTAGYNTDSDLCSNLLAPIDQLHIGGRKATLNLLEKAGLQPDCHILEIGSGLGGTARLIADQIPCTLTAVDITPDFHQAHAEINQRLQQPGIRTVCADACEPQVADKSQDLVISQHTLMNIPDKPRLLATLARSLKPEGKLLLHEVIAGENTEPLQLPVPWASDAEHSHLPDRDTLIAQIENAGFSLQSCQDVTDQALAWRQKHTERESGNNQPGQTQKASPLNPGLIFGERFLTMGKNVMANLASDKIRVIEAVFTRTP